MTQQSIQLELMELQRRVEVLEGRLGLGVGKGAEGPRGDGTSLAEQLVFKRELIALRRRVQMLEERVGMPVPTGAGVEEGTEDGGVRETRVDAVAVGSVMELGDGGAGASAAEEVEGAGSDGSGGSAGSNGSSGRLVEDAAVVANAEVPPATGIASDQLAARSSSTRAVPALAQREPFSLERLVGGKWFGWVGSIAVVIGVGLLLKYGYEQRWFTVSPLLRCLMGAAFGLGMIGVGELVRKRVTLVAAAGILAAGVGTVYASAFAAYRLYGLLTEVPGMVLLAFVAALGIAVGVRSRLISVTVLSLIGGYLAPFIIPGRSVPAVLPVFLLMLMTVGLVISARMGGMFRALRSLVWWATLIIGGGWVLNVGIHHTALALVFIGLVWGGIHAELVFAVRRSAGTVEDDAAAAKVLSWRSVVSSFSTTAWCTVLGVRALDVSGAPEWIAPAALMSATAMLWMVLAGTLDTLRERPRNEAERLGAAMFAQAAGLLVVTLAIALSAKGEVVSWTVLALAAMVAARWLRVRALDVYAVIVLAITTARVLFIEAFATRGGSPVFGFVVNDWTLVAALVGGAWVAGAFIVRREGERWNRLTNVLAGVGVAVAAIGLLSPRSESFTGSVIFATAGIAGAGMAFVRRSRGLAEFAWACVVIAAPMTLATRWWEVRTPHAMNILGLHLEPVALCLPWVGVAVLAAAWSAARVRLGASMSAERRAWMAGLAASGVLLLGMGGFYHDRANLSSVCLAWLVLAFAVAAAGRVWPGRRLELVGLAGLLPVTFLWIPSFGMQWSPSSAPFVLHPGLGVAGLIGAAWWVACAWVRKAESQLELVAGVRVATAVAIGALVFTGSSLEAARIASGITADPTVRGAALSMWWGVLAIVMVGLGFWRRVQAVRWTGLGVLAIAMFKAVFFDLQDVPQLWRIVSFIGLGLMMLMVPVVYSRMSYVFKSREERAGTLEA
jgi:hypothetical protein